jgi:hypothetical protein
MKKARLIAGMTAAIPAAGALAIPAAAHATQATTASPHQVKGKTVLLHGLLPETFGPQWAEVSYPETLYFRSGGTYPDYSGQIYVTCYYSGAPHTNDKYWDHFTKFYEGRVQIARAGHLWDGHVDFNGQLAPQVLPHC